MSGGIFLGKWLARNSGIWDLPDNHSIAFVQVIRKGETVGGFAFHKDQTSQLVQALASAALDLQECETKLVVGKADSAAAQTQLRKQGLQPAKIVEREGRCALRFDSEQGKVFVAAIGQMAATKKIKVLIVDDSPTIRKILEKLLSSDPEFEVVGGVGLPSEVVPAIERWHPDVITLDIHLPEMNGVELLKRYLPKFRIPTVMVSSISVEEGPLVLNALEAGAVDYIQKPSSQELEAVAPQILQRIRTAAMASLQNANTLQAQRLQVDASTLDFSKLIAIGSSTGGTEALKEIFIRFPESIPPVLVVQHIPAVFSKAFAERLDSLCPFEICEATDGMEVKANRVIIAPGGQHMRLRRSAAGLLIVALDETPPVNRHRPSADVLFDSVREVCGQNAVAAILTGMGTDGAKGLLGLKEKGCLTLGQDEKSCVVFGMPQAAMKMGATCEMVSLFDIAKRLVEGVSRKRKISA